MIVLGFIWFLAPLLVVNGLILGSLLFSEHVSFLNNKVALSYKKNEFNNKVSFMIKDPDKHNVVDIGLYDTQKDELGDCGEVKYDQIDSSLNRQLNREEIIVF